jgi:hypothetical protein
MAYQKSLHIAEVNDRIPKDADMRVVERTRFLPLVSNRLFSNLLIMDALTQLYKGSNYV